MVANLSIFIVSSEVYIKVSILTEENRMKYTIYVDASDRIALPYILRDLNVTHISIDDNITADWFSALALLFNEFEAV